jgi:7-cyano-7-deazaguanine synthase
VNRAVVLLSGGLDSTTTLAVASREFEVFALSFRYGQRHDHELTAARRIAQSFNVADHVTLDIDLRAFGGSALTDDIAVPKDRDLGRETGIPVTYVPARNTIFLSFAVGYAEVLEARDIFIGVNALDYSGYPDCRPEFIRSFEQTANLGTRIGMAGENPIRIRAPLIDMTKADIIKLGASLGVDYAVTVSCYDPVNEKACGRCDACQLRRKGFRDAGVPDPTLYADLLI